MTDKPCCFAKIMEEGAYRCTYKKKCDNQVKYNDIYVCRIELKRFEDTREIPLVLEDFVEGLGI